MRARRAERRICHCGNARKVDKRLVGKDRIYFDYASLVTGPFSVVLVILYYLGLEPECYLSIHHALMVKPMEIISRQDFGEWVCKIVAGLYLPHLHNIVVNILPKTMLP